MWRRPPGHDDHLSNSARISCAQGVCVVQHAVPSTSPDVLSQILTRSGVLPAHTAVDGLVLRPGRIYSAPPDAHLLVGPGHQHVAHGAKENDTR
jgi:two-component system chemotaxis response regulator CheB